MSSDHATTAYTTNDVARGQIPIERTPIPKMQTAGGTMFTPAATSVATLTPELWVAAPTHVAAPAITPLPTRTPTATRILPPIHDDRETGRTRSWSSRPWASSVRAADTCPAATNAVRTARMRNDTPKKAFAPVPGAPSREKTVSTDEPEIVAPAAFATRPVTTPVAPMAHTQPLTVGRTRRIVRP